MGSGKSKLGKALSKDLKVPFVDLDALIEKEAGCTISAIFTAKGETYFRNLEAKTLRTLKGANAVIALGGGAPCFLDNSTWIGENGDSFFLDLTTAILAERLLGETEKRPLLKGKNKEELYAFIDQRLEERRPFYEQANFSIKETNLQKMILEIKEKRS